MIAIDLLLEEGNKTEIKHFSFLNSSVTFFFFFNTDLITK